MKSLLLTGLFLVFGSLGWAANALDATALQQTLRVLVDGAPEERTQAIAALEKMGQGNAERQVVHRLLQSYGAGTLYFWNEQVVFTDAITLDSNYNKQINPLDVVSGALKVSPEFRVPIKQVKVLAADRNERDQVADALLLVALDLESKAAVLAAVTRIASVAQPEKALLRLDQLAQGHADSAVRFSADEAAALIRLKLASDPTTQIALIEKLGKLPSLQAGPVLEALSATEKDSRVLKAVSIAQHHIEEYQGLVNLFDILKSSLSTGSILILMALGLAITFGMMGVINMAHGEMMMIGAYTTLCVQIIFGHTTEHAVPEFFLVALPLSFLAAALVGALMESLVVRHLYRKPLESLLATYGVSLILTQVIRLIFGDNRATNSPDWLQGAFGIAQGMEFPLNRLFILATAVLCVLAVVLIFQRTKMGLHMKATMQNRDMAAAMGINTRRVDRFTFMLGSGLAGVAGYALTTVGGITPDMGKNYIIDSFLVVVTGGAGSIAGVIVSGAGIGFLNKFLEGTLLGTVWAKIVVLALVMMFIQFKPSGIFAPKGRQADE